ncbi:hypothetical protein [Winogradskyella luteola]|uniref:Uncharacterized protein n=1 Tax=Winogradskyella luteola TaxID=2828330 RepID=A0A9X1F8D7_9FLAO|nr:hypothetical protein [Winogradskyella luteola]MBV7269069.1 hypothetical protein [Winogradskyella luteola]
MLRLKLKAGALQLTMFIIVVIALLLTAFILLVHTHNQFQIQSDFIIQLTKQSNYGVDYTLENTIPLNDTTSIDLNDEDYKTLKVHRDFWGLFEKVLSTSKIKNKRFQKVALIGSKQPINNRTALYIQDNNKPLVLVGDTKIEGLTYLPRQGVKPGYISGQSYYGSKLIFGPTRVSSVLPKLSSEVIDNIRALEYIALDLPQNRFLNVEEGGHYSNSFLKPLEVVFSNSSIDLRTIHLTGHILVQSKSKIVVHSTSKLKDVILVAPKIEIKPRVVGNFQAIASKEILVGDHVQINYPSALVVNEKPNTQTDESSISSKEEHHLITINENSVIKGSVVFLGQEKSNNYKSQLQIKENTVIYGELYNNQNTELQGMVYGSVYTDNFIANQAGSVYQNHIYNGTIIVDELPKQYAGLLINNPKKCVLKWLY